MFIVVVGGGKLGTYLAKTLLEEHHEVIVVEKDERKAERLCQVLDCEIAQVGDGCDPLVLEDAGVARADVVVADTGDDEDNLVISSTEVVMKMIQQEVNVREVAPLMAFKGGNLELVRLAVPDGSPANRKRLSDLKLPRHCVIVALERGGEVTVPGGDTTVESGDVMLIITEPGATPELRTQLVGATR